jgi:hypothetical protein
MAVEGSVARQLALVDAVDHLLNRGVVLTGNASISLAGVDLVYLGLNLFLGSTETLRQYGAGNPLWSISPPPRSNPPSAPPAPAFRPELSEADVREAAQEAGTRGAAALTLEDLSNKVQAADEPSAANGLAKLVLTLVELLRQVLERQAIRRMDGGALTDDEIERMGLALLELEKKMTELREVFGFEEGDLTLDLGPLGGLLDD